MTLSRGIPLSAHGAIEVIAGPAIMAAPFVLGFGAVATVLAIVLGALVLTMSLQLEHPGRALPLSAHAGFDYALAFTALFAGLGFAVSGSWAESVFLVGIGVAQAALTASTRFSSPAPPNTPAYLP
jgi:hypothetical protein